mgnify:CR=1 FL=1
MIIDFHTHIFPDAIAQRTIEKLEAAANIKAHSDGTLTGLKTSMQKAGVDMTNADYLERAFDVFEQRLDQLEALLADM